MERLQTFIGAILLICATCANCNPLLQHVSTIPLTTTTSEVSGFPLLSTGNNQLQYILSSIPQAYQIPLTTSQILKGTETLGPITLVNGGATTNIPNSNSASAALLASTAGAGGLTQAVFPVVISTQEVGGSASPVFTTIPSEVANSQGVLPHSGISGSAIPVSGLFSSYRPIGTVVGGTGSSLPFSQSPSTLQPLTMPAGSPITILSNYGELIGRPQNQNNAQHFAMVNIPRLPPVVGTGTSLNSGSSLVSRPILSNVNPLQSGDMTNSHGNGAAVHIPQQSARPWQVQTVPCMLQIPHPVPITMVPGASPSPAVSVGMSASPSAIPSSYIDNTPPTVSILRPPPVANFDSQIVNQPITAPIEASETIIETPAKIININSKVKKERSQESRLEKENQNEEAHAAAADIPSRQNSMGRSGFPIVYAILPSTIPTSGGTSGSSVSTAASSNKGKSSSSTSSSARPTRGKNPYFNVNKRKHFEYYEYF